MEMSGEYRIPAPREEVWAALNDPEVLRKSIPGAESVNKIADDEFEAVAKAKVGPVSARFKGKVKLTDIDPPNGYTISGEGNGGAAGFAKGSARVTLTEADDGTLLAYTVNAQVGGKLAQIGQRCSRRILRQRGHWESAGRKRGGQDEVTHGWPLKRSMRRSTNGRQAGAPALTLC